MTSTKNTHDWDIQYFHYMTEFIDKKINILQVGCTHHFNIDFFKSYILTHKDSHMYSINFCDTNNNNNYSINTNHNTMTAVSKDNIHLYDHASYHVLIEFSKQKIEFDIIIFYDDMSDDLFSQLVLTFNLLKTDGILFIYQSENVNKNIDDFHKTIQLFTELKNTQIEILKESDQYIFIRKKSIPKMDKMENKKIKEALKNMLSTQPIPSFTLPTPQAKIDDLVFELKTSDKPVKNMTKYGFIPEYDDYEDYLIHDKDNKINVLDPKFIISTRFDDKEHFDIFKNIIKKIKIQFNDQIKKILQKYFSTNLHQIIYYIDYLTTYSKKKNDIYFLNISTFTPKSGILKGYDEFIKIYNRHNNHLYYPYSNEFIHTKYDKNIHLIHQNYTDHYSYTNMNDLTSKIHHKIDLIQISLLKYVKQNFKNSKYYSFITSILINILYLILSLQNKNGILILNIPIISTQSFIEFLYLLSFLYKNITITKSIKKKNNDIEIKIVAKYFIKNQSRLLSNIKKICIQYSSLSDNYYTHISSFLTNKIPISFVHSIKKILRYFYKYFIYDIKNKILLLSYSNDPYIIRKIINKQINKSIEFNSNFDKLLKNLITKS